MKNIFIKKPKDYSIFDNHYVNLTNLEIMGTRRCNLACAHCMRGKASNETINEETLDAIFSKFKMIGSLTIGGGEVSLTPEIFDMLLKSIIKNLVVVKNINFVTNGTIFSEELLQNLIEIKKYLSIINEADEKHTHSSEKLSTISSDHTFVPGLHLDLSVDAFHLAELKRLGIPFAKVKENIQKYVDVLGEECFNVREGSDIELIAEGKAKNLVTDVPKVKPITKLDMFYATSGDGLINLGLGMEISTDGEVVPFNTSYANEKVISAGNIVNESLGTIMSRIQPKQIKLKDWDKFQSRSFKRNLILTRHAKKYYRYGNSNSKFVKEELQKI